MGSKQRWAAASVSSVRQVTKTNFAGAVERITNHIQQSDYIAISAQKTGGARRPWQRVLPIDTPRIAYLKAKLAAETYELLQLAVCPFRIDGSRVVAFPYNFQLFPRDEMNTGLPTYSFACQSSFLASMAREGFDFNDCIYNGISYLSRVQESEVKDQDTATNGVKLVSPPHPSLTVTAADKIFTERVTSRIQHWRNACTKPIKPGEDELMASLRKLIVGGELHDSRPCLSIDVCSRRQVQLVIQVLNESFDDLVPVVLSDRCGSLNAVRVILTSSDEDKKQLVDELQNEDEKRNKTLRGFREVIDLISVSHKPIISNGCLHDFAFIHSKFIAPLPSSMAEFMCSLKLAFCNVLDISHLLREVGPLRKTNNLPAALSYLRRKFPLPTLLEIPQDNDLPNGSHGHNVLRITQVFAKLRSILNSSSSHEIGQGSSMIENYGYFFHPCAALDELEEEDVGLWKDNSQRVSSDNLVFIWGFREEISVSELKILLHGTHVAFLEDFDLKLLEKGCAVLIFRKPGLASEFLEDMETGKIDSGSLVDLISSGVKATGYEAYKRVCTSGLWDMDLAHSLDQSLLSLGHGSSDAMHESLDVY